MGRRPVRITIDQVHPLRLYTAAETAEALGLCLDTVYRLGIMRNSRLPKVPVGVKGGKTLFRGRDILRYAGLETEHGGVQAAG